MFEIGLGHYLVVTSFMFVAGIVVMTLKRNAIGILIGAELVLNAGAINFVAFERFRAGGLDGQLTAIFVVVLAAAEAAIALAVFLNFYSGLATIDVDRGDTLKG